jgi:hypothetical protein
MTMRRVPAAFCAAAAALLAVLLMPATSANASEKAIGGSYSKCYTIKSKGHNDVLVHTVATRNQYGGFAGYGLIGVGNGCDKPNTVPVSYMALYHVTLMTSTGKIISEVNGGSTRHSSHVGAFTRHVVCGSHQTAFRVRVTVAYAYTDGDYTSVFNVYGPYFHC